MSGPPAAGASGLRDHLAAGALLWLAGVVLWATRTPFLPRPEPWELTLAPPTVSAEAVGNVLLLAPMGLLLGLAVARRDGARARHPHAVLWLCLVALCAAIEAGQVFVESRLVSPYDFALNLAGASLGQGIGGWLGRQSVAVARRGLMAVGGVLALAYLGLCVFFLARAATARDGLRLQDWDPGYEIVAGDEVGGERPYEGTVARAGICVPRPDRVLCGTEGAGPETRGRLARAAMQAQAVRLEARVRSSSSRQTGPTRIVTFSAGPGLRNATLGQSGDDLVLRLRTPMGGPNGTGVAYRLTDAVPVGEEVSVTASYRHGAVSLTARTRDGTRSTVFTPGPAWAWTWLIAGEVDPRHEGQPVWAAMAGLIVVLFPAGFAGGWSAAGRRRAVSLAAGAASSLAMFGAFAAVLGGAPAPLATLAAAAGAVAAGVALRDRRVWWRRYSRGGSHVAPTGSGCSRSP